MPWPQGRAAEGGGETGAVRGRRRLLQLHRLVAGDAEELHDGALQGHEQALGPSVRNASPAGESKGGRRAAVAGSGERPGRRGIEASSGTGNGTFRGREQRLHGAAVGAPVAGHVLDVANDAAGRWRGHDRLAQRIQRAGDHAARDRRGNRHEKEGRARPEQFGDLHGALGPRRQVDQQRIELAQSRPAISSPSTVSSRVLRHVFVALRHRVETSAVSARESLPSDTSPIPSACAAGPARPQRAPTAIGACRPAAPGVGPFRSQSRTATRRPAAPGRRQADRERALAHPALAGSDRDQMPDVGEARVIDAAPAPPGRGPPIRRRPRCRGSPSRRARLGDEAHARRGRRSPRGIRLDAPFGIADRRLLAPPQGGEECRGAPRRAPPAPRRRAAAARAPRACCPATRGGGGHGRAAGVRGATPMRRTCTSCGASVPNTTATGSSPAVATMQLLGHSLSSRTSRRKPSHR